MAKMLYVDDSLIRRYELGGKSGRVPPPGTLEKLEDIYGTGGVLGEMRNDLITNDVPVEWFDKWPKREQDATALYSFEPSLVPGLLQAEDYAHAVIRAGKHGASDIEEMVAARMERQHILTKDDPPMCVFLIAECALRHAIRSAATMREQLSRLADMGERENVALHVIPEDKPACAAFMSGFVIAEFEGGYRKAYVDNQLDGREIEDPVDVARLQRFFDVFRGDVLDREGSRELIRRKAEKWNE